VAALLDDAAGVEDDDPVGTAYRRSRWMTRVVPTIRSESGN
jgi:hypothetical protein